MGGNKVPASIRHDIIERTDGIPLFVEEITKAVLEAGGGEAGERAIAAIPSPSIAVPASLHALSLRGLAVSVRRRRSHKLARLLGESSLMLYWRRWCASQKANSILLLSD